MHGSDVYFRSLVAKNNAGQPIHFFDFWIADIGIFKKTNWHEQQSIFESWEKWLWIWPLKRVKYRNFIWWCESLCWRFTENLFSIFQIPYQNYDLYNIRLKRYTTGSKHYDELVTFKLYILKMTPHQVNWCQSVQR